MNKEYKIKLDLNKKLYNKKMTFNQFDENVNDFYIEVTKNNEVVKDLDKSIITLVAIKPNNTVEAQFVEVENGLVYADLKPSMCDLVGNYQAKAMIALEGKIITTDTIIYSVNEDKIISRLNEDVVSDERFTLFTDALARLSDIEASEEQRITNEAERILAEENRKIEEAKRVEAELIRQHEEADRTKYDAIRESNENIRKQNESIRLANETNRIDEEAKRVEEENKRKLAEEERNANYNFMTEDEERRRSEANAHKEAEVLRVQAETNRVNEEAKRRNTEQARVSAENTRVGNENTREANEVVRKNNENQRVEAETQRQSRYNSFILDAEANANNFENYTNNAKVNEEERKSNELDRKSQEDRRVSNEVERISNENTRKANEIAREKNETSRQNIFENKVDEVDEKISELNTTKDNFISSVNTKVDNKISEIEVAKSDMTNTVSNKVNEVENRFNALTSKQQQSSEVIDARDGETSLKARLDRDIEKAKQVYVNVEGSHISTDSSVGYLKDVEILGNTIQDASNLADIRSVGDTVEGQELYEIPVLSVSENIFNNKWELGDISSTGENVNSTSKKRTDFIKIGGSNVITPCMPKYVKAEGARYIFMRFYDKSKKHLGGTIMGDNYIRNSFTPPVGSEYVRFTMDTTITECEFEVFLDKRKFVFEGNLIESTPYVEDKLTILSPVQLEKVGDVADRIICKDGVWGVEKNVETITFDGSEDEKLSYYNNYVIFEDIKYSRSYLATQSVNTITWNGVDRFGVKNTNITSLATAKVWLQDNPTIIKYPTAQPQFIPLPHSQQIKLRTFANKTNISFLTEIEGTIKAQVPKSLGATVNTHTEQINNLNKELDRVKKLEESTVSTVTTESDFTIVEATSNGYFEDVKLEGKTLVVNSDNEVVESGTDGAMLKSVGEDADEIVVSSNNNQPKQIKTTDDNSITTTIDNPNYQSDKKHLLYYNNETQTWEKPILREWDSIEKHADGKYYYHQRSGEVVLNGSENWHRGGSSDSKTITSYFGYAVPNIVNKNYVYCDNFPGIDLDVVLGRYELEGVRNSSGSIYININKARLSEDNLVGFKQWLQANNVTVVYQLAQEKVYECTNIDLITYSGETNYIVECGAIAPRSTLKVHNNISNVVSLLQKKVSLLESNITSYMITQNRLMLASRYNADTVSFKVDVASLRNSFEYDNDLYELILNNILVGKDNYNRDYIENLIIFYWMDFVISDEMYSTLFEIIEEQHNPKVIEAPIE